MRKNPRIMQFTKYERARLIGARALQIAMGAPILLKLKKAGYIKYKYNPVNLAKEEFGQGVLPITVKRPLPVSK